MRISPAYERIQQMVAEDRCVILDGGVGTEAERISSGGYRNREEGLWGTAALYDVPYAVLQVHQRYVRAGCDVISTNTWGILNAPELEGQSWPGYTGPVHWMDIARLGIRLARQAIAEGGKDGQCALAFAITGDVNTFQRQETIRLLTRVLAEDPPDLILLETLSLIREDVTYPTVDLLLETGLPVWLSFRRCRHGVCGVHGEHWGGPEGDLFGRAARRFEEMGVGALLINCLPPDHVPGMLPWLRDFTDLPLGVYPNLGYDSEAGWRFDRRLGPEEYAQLALQWREEGAQIVGGCCGVTPEHIEAVGRTLAGTKRGRARSPGAATVQTARPLAPPGSVGAPQPWLDGRGRSLYPLPLPRIVCEPGVFVPTLGSFLVWKHLFQTGMGQGQQCLDVGCGSGILAVQLALNGADHVHAIDIQPEAVANTLSNAFRNGVAERVTAAAVDLYDWSPEERYDVIVASLYQMPVDPFAQVSSHRPVDYWGRNMLDHLFRQLPRVLSDGGIACIMQLSILSQIRTAQLAEEAGLDVRVVDFSFFPFSPLFRQHGEQIQRVEQLSDAYHFTLGSEDMMVAYLLGVTRKR
ncbi:MAG: homocysteine S-methyltransferase family protein [Chloroflexi bacterium]|nr:homocysteine S-methyltransferase family protein [Chloroflexota bacterium]